MKHIARMLGFSEATGRNAAFSFISLHLSKENTDGHGRVGIKFANNSACISALATGNDFLQPTAVLPVNYITVHFTG